MMNWIIPIHIVASAVAVVLMLGSFFIGTVYLVQERQLKTKKMGRFFWSLPSLLTSEQGSFRWLQFGFGILTLTILSGVILVYQFESVFNFFSVGHIILSVGVWFLYLVILARRRKSGWHGRRIILLSILGFIIILLVYLNGQVGSSL